NLTTAVIVLDQDYCLFHMNPSAESLLETSCQHSRTSHVNELLRDPVELLNGLATVARTDTTLITRKSELMLANGNLVCVDYAVTPGQHHGVQCFLRDLDALTRPWCIARKGARIARHEATIEMIRGLSHEIKNPRCGICGAAQLLGSELPDPPLQD